MTGYRSWSGPAKAMAIAIDAAVSAAQLGDADDFGEAISALDRTDREQLAIVLGAVMRHLLEVSHPDGLDSADVQEVLDRCQKSAAWYDQVDPDCFVGAFAGALGISDPEESPTLGKPAVMVHGLLLIADQLTTLMQPLAPVLEDALRELMRAQTVELP